MDELIRSVGRYLKENLGIGVTAQRWEGETGLPFFLRNLYAFYQVSLLDTPSLLMLARDEAEQTPATVRKHLFQVEEKWGGMAIYVHPLVSSYNRKRLIQHKVPFIIPGNQMYLPYLGIDLREHFREARYASPQFAPSTQAVVLHALLQGSEQPFTPSGLVSHLGYAAMTMTRAFDELEMAGLVDITTEGRERVMRFNQSKLDLWEDARPFLRSPVKNRVWVELPPDERPRVEAGLTALAHYTNLAAPAQPVYGLSGDEWRALEQRGKLVKAATPEPGSVELEIWSYAPRLFAEQDRIDRFSLYLSLQESTDERVESALDEMMGQIPW